MSMEWYRAYHGMPYDTKLRVIARRTSQPMAVVVAIWTCMLDAASQHDPRGFIKIDPEEVAVVQDLELQVVEAVLQAFHDKGMIDENNHLTAWDKRQHTTSTERSRKHRDTKQQDATSGNTAQQSATAGNTQQRKNAPDTDADYRTDTDSEAESEADSKKDSKQKKKRTRAEKKEREKEKQQIGGKNILQEMLDIWNEEVQSKLTNSHKAILTPKRKELLTVRWIEDFAEDIKAWRYFCEIIGKSDFCLGRIEGKNWTIDLSWAIESSEHVASLREASPEESTQRHRLHAMNPNYKPRGIMCWHASLANMVNPPARAGFPELLSKAQSKMPTAPSSSSPAQTNSSKAGWSSITCAT